MAPNETPRAHTTEWNVVWNPFTGWHHVTPFRGAPFHPLDDGAPRVEARHVQLLGQLSGRTDGAQRRQACHASGGAASAHRLRKDAAARKRRVGGVMRLRSVCWTAGGEYKGGAAHIHREEKEGVPLPRLHRHPTLRARAPLPCGTQ